MTLEEKKKILGYDPTQPETEEGQERLGAIRRLRMLRQFTRSNGGSLSSLPLPNNTPEAEASQSDGKQPT